MEWLPEEGTLFASTYRGAEQSAIVGLYCDEPASLSRFHRLSADEMWHFYEGDPLELVLLAAEGASSSVVLGPGPGQLRQCLVPAGVWQAARMIRGGTYSLYGCTVAPPWEARRFEAGTSEELLRAYPDRRPEILALT